MRHDNGVRIIQGSLCHKHFSIVGVEVFLIGNKNIGHWVKFLELLSELTQHVVRDHIKGFVYQADPPHFHTCGNHGEGLSGSNCMI